MYRNPMTEVCDFLNKYHDGQYKVYNLCTRPQDQYDPGKFGGNVASFPFADHGVPPLAVVDELAHSVQNWVTSAPERIVCIHCLAGKGRTGLMVCAALLLLGSFSSAGDAMAFYGERRMKNKKGVTQASQRRWVEYYQQSLTGRVDMQLQRTLVQVRVDGYPASKHLSLQVITPGGKQLLDTGPFGGQASVCLGLSEDFCFQLLLLPGSTYEPGPSYAPGGGVQAARRAGSLNICRSCFCSSRLCVSSAARTVSRTIARRSSNAMRASISCRCLRCACRTASRFLVDFCIRASRSSRWRSMCSSRLSCATLLI